MARKKHGVATYLDLPGLLQTHGARNQTIAWGITRGVGSLVEDDVETFVPNIGTQSTEHDKPRFPDASAPDRVVAEPDAAVTRGHQMRRIPVVVVGIERCSSGIENDNGSSMEAVPAQRERREAMITKAECRSGASES